MAIATENRRPRFESTSSDPEPQFSKFVGADDGLSLPPLDPDAYQQPYANAALSEIIAAVLEEPGIEATLESDVSFGPVVKPTGSTLYDYKQVLSRGEGATNIQFSAKNYGIFDGIIVDTCGMDAQGQPRLPAFNFRHANFKYYAPLRRNLAVLRNYLMVRHPPSGNGGKSNELILRLMAAALGKALRGEVKELSRFMQLLVKFKEVMMGVAPPKPSANRFLELANTPDRGIAFLYNYLYMAQAEPAFMGALPPLQWPKNWQFLPLEQTPFSSVNMIYHSDAARMASITIAFEQMELQFRPVAEMNEVDKERAVEIARDILKNMRIYNIGRQEEKSYEATDPRMREAQVMLQQAANFVAAMAELKRSNPEALSDPALVEAQDAVGKINHRLQSEQKLMAKEENRPELGREAERRAKSASSKHKSKEPIGQLLHKLEEGINRIAELRKNFVAKTKQKSAIANAMGKQNAPNALTEGMSTMSGSKIHQVSVADPDLIQGIKRANEPQGQEQQKENIAGGGTGIGRK